VVGLEPGGVPGVAKTFLGAAIGAAAFGVLTFLAESLSPFWLSFPLFCAGLLALGLAGDRLARDDAR
jgi:hypothetical protein